MLEEAGEVQRLLALVQHSQPGQDRKDSWKWRWGRGERFSVSSAHNIISDGGRSIMVLQVTFGKPTVRSRLRCWFGGCHTGGCLLVIGWHPLCRISRRDVCQCGEEEEDLDHLLVRCSFARSLRDRPLLPPPLVILGSPSAAGKVNGTVTASGAVVEDWLRHVQHIHRRRLNRLMVGLDVEWHPNFGRGVDNPPVILQLCVGRRCLVFQILHADYVPDRLADFLEDERFMFVGIGIDEDADNLDRHWGLAVGRTRDLRHLVAEASHLPEMRGCGLAGLAEEVMGLHGMTKDSNVTLSQSDQWWLSREQIMYAVTDGFLSFEIGRHVIAGDYPLFYVNM
ncbi:hypothetical protein Taro_018984 [Colocasia esculenta]|uniref:3'-5' exonuclease domain-containing protein n=1 Tax=Colocasia esculenta TaxID=4460 RepID=A0A843V443_COLES|nr:hypothetical protein [Colocasia esculenta]